MDDFINCCCEGGVPFLPMGCIPIQRESMHDISAQEVGEFLGGALNEHSKAGVEVGDACFQSSDVVIYFRYLFHKEFLCELSRANRCA